jgi:hypothetical protein
MKTTPRSQVRLPFQGLSGRSWLNLAMAGLIVFYFAQVFLDVARGNLFGNLGVDFASFWSAGYIANRYGYASVYDLELMAQFQHQLMPAGAATSTAFRVIPTPYLPVFLLPFQSLALLPPSIAAGAWIVLNLVGCALYLRTFASRVAGHGSGTRLALMLMISAPAFLNFFLGQANLWLMICVGEFLLAARAGKAFPSGVWLAGLLLKPQCLILIVPAVLMQRWRRTTLGVMTASVVIIGCSWLLAGTDALSRLVQLWLGYMGGLPTNDLQLMMNWRMVGLHLSRLSTPQLGWTATILGLAATALAALYLWRARLDVSSPRFPVALVGTLAATGAVAWHSHVHMAMIMIPPLAYLHLKHRELLRARLEWWVFLPAGVNFIRLMLAAVMRASILSSSIIPLLDSLAGIGQLSVNLYLLGWALDQARSWKAEPVGTT